MPRILSRLRKARLRQDGAQGDINVVHDAKSAQRSESSKRSRGHDERGHYGKGADDPDDHDDYKDKD